MLYINYTGNIQDFKNLMSQSMSKLKKHILGKARVDSKLF